MVTTLKNFLTSLLFGCFSAFILFACNKDASPEMPQPENNQSQNISIEEIKLIYGDLNTEGYAQSRSGAQLPLDVLPAWSSAYSYNNAPMPVIMVPVDTASLHQDNRQGGNLVFFKNNIGVIQCILLMWQANSSTDYTSNKAPLDLASQFSGMMLLVDVQNNIRRIMEVNSGVVIKAKEGSISILEIGGENLSNNAAQDRDPKCPKWGPNWWDRVWNWMGNVFDGILDFFGNIWDNGVGHESLPAGTFIFGGQGGINTFGYTDPGSSSIREQQLAAQMTTCQAIREYMESIGETPSGYSDTDLRFCQLVNELGLNGQQNACLFNQYGTSYINELYEYWATSDQSLATTEKIKEYIDLKCSGGFSALLTDMVKEQFCLSQNPIDLMEKIKNHCGYSSYESSEWYGDFNNGLSACVQEAIIEDRIGYIESRYGVVVTAAELEVITEGDPYSCDALSKIDIIDLGFEDFSPPPVNTPISISKAACKTIFDFNQYTDPFNPNWTVRAAILGNVNLEFKYGGTDKLVVINCIGMTVTRKDNSASSNCLNISDELAASVLNTAVFNTQTDVNSFPVGMNDVDFHNMINTRMIVNLSRAASAVTGLYGCSNYSSYATIYQNTLKGGAYLLQPISTNCDLKMADCN